MTVSQPKNNNSLSVVRCPTQNVAYGRFASQSCSERRSKVQTSVMLMQSWCFVHKGWIHLQQTRKAATFNRRNLRAPSTRIRMYIFFKSEIYLSTLAFRPHVVGIFGRRRSRFSQMVQRVEISENDVRMDEYRGFRKQHCACTLKGCYRISFILAFLCGRAKKIPMRFVWTRISDTCGQGLIFFLTLRGIKTM